jgi:D-3-phosphoglycerate dehydrogenase
MNHKWKVLVSAPYLQPEIERFRGVFEENGIETIVPSVEERMDEDQLLGIIGDIDGVISGDDQFTGEVLRRAKKLKVISKWGTGIDSIDGETCRELGISVKNIPDAFSEAVGDTVLGYMLCFARNIVSADRELKKGTWRKIRGTTLAESSLGVIGVGNAGKAVVRRAAAFGMTVYGSDIVEIDGSFVDETGIVMTSLEALLGKADYVSVNCDLNPTSLRLINRDSLGLMKSGAILINTARGPVVDENSLVRALADKTIAGAALDVFEEEPLPLSSPLRGMDNVLLSPHNANSSPRAWEAVHNKAISNLLEGLREGTQR